ncbi:MAG: hypothetical protein M1825_006221 [Sarcosagium campestre]|nr:MAG: hypothetical protein M1825_006221 [Sarcosagium campestre]
MATILRRLAVAAPQCPRRIRQNHYVWASHIQHRAFTSSPHNRDDNPSKSVTVEPRISGAQFKRKLDPESRDQYESLSADEKLEFQKEWEQLEAQFDSPEDQSRLNAMFTGALRKLENKGYEEPEAIINREEKDDDEIEEPGYLAIEEDDEREIGADPEFAHDDLTTLGHAELDQAREMRHYARIIAWEMPLLSKMVTPFEPPGLDRPLRFRYTSYMGEEHPAEKKVVLEFCTKDLPDLTQVQRSKLIKLVGVRYNPSKDIVKMSCEMFETQAQNKRYLGDLVDTLLREARDPTDTFEDIPFDFRHHKSKPVIKFPRHWSMTPERRQYLEDSRKESLLLEQQRVEQGRLVDGLAIVNQAHAAMPVMQPQTVASQRGKGKVKVLSKGKARR